MDAPRRTPGEIVCMLDRRWGVSKCRAWRPFYRRAKLLKPDGSYRKISKPDPALAELQHWLVTEVWPSLHVHECSHATSGKSIFTHAEVHAPAGLLITMDLAKFFDSIDTDQVCDVLVNAGFTARWSVILARLCTYDGVLPQGAATSPGLANAVFYEMDHKFSRLGFRYSRYVDDLAFSLAPPAPSKVFWKPRAEDLKLKVEELLSFSPFRLNSRKTRVRLPWQKQMVTGLVVNQAPRRPKVRAPREMWDRMRVGLYKWKQGEVTYDQLQGLLSFLAITDPERAKPYINELGKPKRWHERKIS